MIKCYRNSDNVVFVTFADNRLIESRERIKSEAINSRFFSKVIVLSEDDLPTNIREFCDKYKNSSSGYGFYIWKPYIASMIANNPDFDGSIVFWIDSGTWINRFGADMLKTYIKSISDEKPFVVFENLSHKETFSTKRDVFDALDAYELINTHPIMAGIFGFKVNSISRSVLSSWINTCASNPLLIDNSPSRSGEEFKGHQMNRHDQGVFSVILKKNDCYNSFSAEHILPELHESYLSMAHYPFVAMRDRPDFFALRDHQK